MVLLKSILADSIGLKGLNLSFLERITDEIYTQGSIPKRLIKILNRHLKKIGGKTIPLQELSLKHFNQIIRLFEANDPKNTDYFDPALLLLLRLALLYIYQYASKNEIPSGINFEKNPKDALEFFIHLADNLDQIRKKIETEPGQHPILTKYMEENVSLLKEFKTMLQGNSDLNYPFNLIEIQKANTNSLVNFLYFLAEAYPDKSLMDSATVIMIDDFTDLDPERKNVLKNWNNNERDIVYGKAMQDSKLQFIFSRPRKSFALKLKDRGRRVILWRGYTYKRGRFYYSKFKGNLTLSFSFFNRFNIYSSFYRRFIPFEMTDSHLTAASRFINKLLSNKALVYLFLKKFDIPFPSTFIWVRNISNFYALRDHLPLLVPAEDLEKIGAGKIPNRDEQLEKMVLYYPETTKESLPFNTWDQLVLKQVDTEGGKGVRFTSFDETTPFGIDNFFPEGYGIIQKKVVPILYKKKYDWNLRVLVSWDGNHQPIILGMIARIALEGNIVNLSQQASSVKFSDITKNIGLSQKEHLALKEQVSNLAKNCLIKVDEFCQSTGHHSSSLMALDLIFEQDPSSPLKIKPLIMELGNVASGGMQGMDEHYHPDDTGSVMHEYLNLIERNIGRNEN